MLISMVDLDFDEVLREAEVEGGLLGETEESESVSVGSSGEDEDPISS